MKSKTYLVNPSDKKILEHSGDRVPIGLMSIAANNPGVKLYDMNHTTDRELMEDFNIDRPENVGISVYTSPALPESLRLAKMLRGKTRLIAGGYHATAMPESLLPYFDAVVQGEGELLLRDAFERDGIITGRAPNLEDLANPTGLDMSKYGVNQSGHRTGTILTSRGCPYHCSFCGKLSDRVRFYSVDQVKAQMDTLKDQDFKALYFMDDVFTLMESRMQEVAEHAETLGMPYRITTRANLIDSFRADVLERTGAEWASFGIESGNDQILKNSNKQMTTRQNEAAVSMMSQRGIKSKGFFILGLPGETEKTARETIDFSLKLRDEGLNQADFYFLSPFPGTPIWKNPSKFGITINDTDFTKYLQAGKTARCVIDTEELKAGRIEELVNEARDLWK